MKVFKTNSPEETIELGKKIGSLLNASDVVLLTGDLSAGKTTITKGIGIALGVKKIINSPTFTIVKSYKGEKCPLYHLDLYRLDGVNNDFDLEEYMEAEGVCVIEWPFQVEEILPKEYLMIELNRLDFTNREIKVSGIGRYSKLEEML
ncbi:MAG: tRNA (adenosine(37)-N6)-threonylcarbamoyltransferase complex ATPase subunit type 1 TsaE [Acholeplasmatales bacterium]|nr:tRNA (adenosine(37)-N6)-threonylcarbamoyltransferase complex ATPase subunit type 1 TsaE [Acholeplasmatales bacterium]